MRTWVKSLFALVICFVFIYEAEAQYFRRQYYWKQYRVEATAGLGISNFLGELGGRDQIGTDFIWDLEMPETQPAAYIGIRYQLSRKAALRGLFSFAIVSGNDELTAERFRSTRNLHFRSNIFELSTQLEYMLWEKRKGHRYDLIGVRGQGSKKSSYIYGIAGIGLTYFNPKALYNGIWQELRPLGTEGQNFADGPKKYSLFTPVIPLGLGYRLNLSRISAVGIELVHRITFTDYIDDVSTVYYDNDAIRGGINGEIAAYLADPSLEFYVDPGSGDLLPGIATDAGAQRGDETDNDAYMFLQVVYSRKLVQSVSRNRKIIRKRGRKIIF